MPFGPLGPIIGKLGDIVGCQGKYGYYVRTRPKARPDKPTAAQLEQRARMAVMTAFLTPMYDLINITFLKPDNPKSPWGRACAYNMRNALYADDGMQKINYSAALVSSGLLPRAYEASAAVTAPGTITFRWSDNSGLGRARRSDKSILVAYCEAQMQCAFITDGPGRQAGVAAIQVPLMAGQTVQTWMAFISENGREVSPSEYTGELVL